jgi:type IV secretory pathway VirB2 component (pilin)
MMKLRSMFLSVAAASIALAPVSVAAAVNPAAKLSVAKSVRTATPLNKSSKAIATPLIIVLVVGVIVAGVVLLDGDNDADSN